LTRFLITTEGKTDKAFIEGVTERLKAACKVKFVWGNRPVKVRRILKTYAGEFNQAIILKDLHKAGRDITTLINELKNEIKELENQGLQPYIIVVKRSIEAWILAGLCVNNPENIQDPEDELKRLMQKTGKHYIKSPEVYKQLAKEVNLKKAAKKSETFKKFIEILRLPHQVNKG
jgi:hypothetical protein